MWEPRRSHTQPNQHTALFPQKLDVGTVLMGEVTAVEDYEMTVSLPNGLVGTVPITEVSLCDELTPQVVVA
jgi:rRNA biogenesis protein RRP5